MNKMPAKGFTHESTYNESKEWYTPKNIFDALGIEFDIDPCSPGKDIVPWIPAVKHLTYLDDGLRSSWTGRAWVNPPYGMDTLKWMDKLNRHGNGIALVFARTDTRWFHAYVPAASAICFVFGRISFIPQNKAADYMNGLCQPKGGCGAASMLVAYGKENAEALFRCGLGLTLPVKTNMEMFRKETGFAGGSRLPNENLPHISENRQGLFSN
jgi:hypothetical protein